MVEGILFIVSAPSGAGKSSLLKELLASDQQLALSISHTTRPPRPGEQDGVHYHFVDRATFAGLVTAGAFLEHASVFGNDYGTSEAAVREQLAGGSDVVLEIDWQGARQVRTRFPDAVAIFILPPSLAALQQRLAARGQDSGEVIAGRMEKARNELSHHGEYEYLVVNDQFVDALADLAAIVRAERLRAARQAARQAALLADLLG